MNILLINHYAGSIRHGMEFRPYYLSREWVRLGHQVTIAAGSYSHVRKTSPRLDGPFTEEMLDGIRYVWLKTPAYQGNGLRRCVSMFAFVSQLIRYQSRLASDGGWDVVVASSTYPLDIVAARRLARRHRSRLIYEVHDLWPLSVIELGGLSRRHPFVAVMQWAENYAYRHVDGVVSMLPNAESHMREHGLPAARFTCVPNGVDCEEWQRPPAPLPDPHQRTLDALRGDERFVVGYCGAHGLANALGTVVEAGALLRDTPASFVLIGQGPEKASLEAMARRLDANNVVFLPPVDHGAMPAVLEQMDCLYLGLKRTPIFRFGISPNKLMDYMMAGRPVIQAIEAGNDLVAEGRCGLSIAPEDAHALADAVRTLMALPHSARDEMGASGRAYVRRHHDYRVLAQRFLDALPATELAGCR